MKNLKRILFFTFALLFFCSVPITGADAASKITAKSVLKDALYRKQDNKDQIVISLNVKAETDTTEMKSKTHESLSGNCTIQQKGKDRVEVLNYKETTGDNLTEFHQYEQYDSKKKNLTSYSKGEEKDEYYRTDTTGDISDIITYDFKKLYSYMSDIKFVKKLTVKNGQKAYCVSAKFDCGKYLNDEDNYRDAFASTMLTIFPRDISNQSIYAKMTAYIDQKTGKMISVKFDMNQYVKTVRNERFKAYTGYGNEDKNPDYSIQVKPSNSYIMVEVNPRTTKKITMPGNYTMLKYNKDQSLKAEYTFVKNKKINEVQYSKDGFVSSSYDKKGTLISEIKTDYADEYATRKQYTNGELLSSTQIDRPDSITVSNVKEFLNAIGHYNLIYLEEGEYNLSDLEIARSFEYSPSIYVNDTYDGFEYIFNCVDHLMIVGKGKASIVIEPRYSTVINIEYSKDVTLKNLTIGHTTGKGECAGGVLYFENSSDITIDSCNLYGCGILGITTDNVSNLLMVDSEIYDCTCGIMSLSDTSNARFLRCKFRDNVGYDMISLNRCTSITYDKCQIYNNVRDYDYYENFIQSNNNCKILFKNCEYHDNTKEYNLTDDDDIEFKDCKIQ